MRFDTVNACSYLEMEMSASGVNRSDSRSLDMENRGELHNTKQTKMSTTNNAQSDSTNDIQLEKGSNINFSTEDDEYDRLVILLDDTDNCMDEVPPHDDQSAVKIKEENNIICTDALPFLNETKIVTYQNNTATTDSKEDDSDNIVVYIDDPEAFADSEQEDTKEDDSDNIVVYIDDPEAFADSEDEDTKTSSSTENSQTFAAKENKPDICQRLQRHRHGKQKSDCSLLQAVRKWKTSNGKASNQNDYRQHQSANRRKLARNGNKENIPVNSPARKTISCINDSTRSVNFYQGLHQLPNSYSSYQQKINNTFSSYNISRKCTNNNCKERCVRHGKSSLGCRITKRCSSSRREFKHSNTVARSCAFKNAKEKFICDNKTKCIVEEDVTMTDESEHLFLDHRWKVQDIFKNINECEVFQQKRTVMNLCNRFEIHSGDTF